MAIAPKKIHYAGALRWTRGGTTTDVGAGFAACCSGDRAWKIRADGAHTVNMDDVTCWHCRVRIEWANGVDKSKRRADAIDEILSIARSIVAHQGHGDGYLLLAIALVRFDAT